jgi:adenine deaminase
LNHEAAKVVRYGGISEEDALAMITINPAKQLGIDEYVGSLEVGKHGDISIWSADPLSIYAVNEMTLVDGQVLFNRETDAVDARLDRAISYDQSFEDLQSEVSEAVRGRQDYACMEDAFILFESGLQTEQTHNH